MMVTFYYRGVTSDPIRMDVVPRVKERITMIMAKAPARKYIVQDVHWMVDYRESIPVTSVTVILD